MKSIVFCVGNFMSELCSYFDFGTHLIMILAYNLSAVRYFPLISVLIELDYVGGYLMPVQKYSEDVSRSETVEEQER